MQVNVLHGVIRRNYNKDNDKGSAIDNQIKNLTKQIQTLNKEIERLQNQNKTKNKNSKSDSAVSEKSMAEHQNSIKDQIEEIEEQISNINQEVLKLQSEKSKKAVENKKDDKEDCPETKIVKCSQTMKDAKIQYSAKKKLDRKIKEAESQIAIDKAKGYDIRADEKELSKLIKTNESLEKMMLKSMKSALRKNKMEQNNSDNGKSGKADGEDKNNVSEKENNITSDEDLKGNFLDDRE